MDRSRYTGRERREKMMHWIALIAWIVIVVVVLTVPVRAEKAEGERVPAINDWELTPDCQDCEYALCYVRGGTKVCSWKRLSNEEQYPVWEGPGMTGGGTGESF